MKKTLILKFKPTFTIDVTNWYDGERLSVKERISKLKEDFSDFSIFMQHADYSALEDIQVEIIES